MATRPDDEKPGPASDSQLAEMQAAFEEQLANFEQQLSKHEGPFILGCTSHLQQCFAVSFGLYVLLHTYSITVSVDGIPFGALCSYKRRLLLQLQMLVGSSAWWT